MTSITFFQEDTDYQLPDTDKTTHWIEQVLIAESVTAEGLSFVFCSDSYLHKMNVEYLDHDTLTDIITFNQSESPSRLEGDVFISVDRVKENSIEFDSSFDRELHRVIIHGVLHLIGYNDKTQEEKKEMREKEEACLSLRE